MGNGGCGCNVTNSNIVVDSNHLNNTNYRKLLQIEYSKIDLDQCEDCQIGPFFTKSLTIKPNSIFLRKSLSFKNDMLRNTNYSQFYGDIKKIDVTLDYKKLTTRTNLLRIYSKILTMPIYKYKETFYFFWDNTLRILLYSIILIVENRHIEHRIIKNEEESIERLTLQDNQHITCDFDENYEQTILTQINKDIPRTFSEHKISKSETFTNNLREILYTTAKEDKILGYVQGMSYIVSFLLIVTGNQKAITADMFRSILNMHSNLYNKSYKGINMFLKLGRSVYK